MRRADRLFEIIQVLRQANGPVTADAIASELETGKRTIYRDIAALIARRVPIRGEAGVGYVLERGFDLPPLMLTTDEVEAVTLGAQWVIAHGDVDLARAALGVLAKIGAILPEPLRMLIDHPAIVTPPGPEAQPSSIDVARLRVWSRTGRKIVIDYSSEHGDFTQRVVWPFMVGYMTGVRVVMSWCEMRQDYRIFRLDRISNIDFLDMHYPARPVVLRRRWLALHAQERKGMALLPGRGQ